MLQSGELVESRMAKEVAFDEDEELSQGAMKTFLMFHRSLSAKTRLTARETLRDAEILEIVRFF
jgi:hypothetical protein